MSNAFIVGDISGDKELAKALEQIPDRLLRKILPPAFRAGSLRLEFAAKRNAPFDDGDLMGSIKAAEGKRRGEVVAGVVVTAPHWHLVEFGHRVSNVRLKRKRRGEAIPLVTNVVPPNPFLRRTLNEEADSITDLVKKHIKASLAELAAKKSRRKR